MDENENEWYVFWPAMTQKEAAKIKFDRWYAAGFPSARCEQCGSLLTTLEKGRAAMNRMISVHRSNHVAGSVIKERKRDRFAGR